MSEAKNKPGAARQASAPSALAQTVRIGDGQGLSGGCYEPQEPILVEVGKTASQSRGAGGLGGCRDPLGGIQSKNADQALHALPDQTECL